MLYVSIKNIDTHSILCFEIEDYYRNPDRAAYTNVAFKTQDQMEIFSDPKLMHDFGFSLALGFMIPLHSKTRGDQRLACAVYSEIENEKFTLQIDEESYRINPSRQLCTSYPLVTLDKERTLHNREFCVRVAETAVSILLPEK